MALPHTPTYVSPFDVITSQAENETQDNIVALSDGTGLNNGAVTASKTSFGGNYSTTEVNTGFTWIDGKTIYKKTVNTGALPNATSKNVAHGITGMTAVIDMRGYTTNGAVWLPIPTVSNGGTPPQTNTLLGVDATNIILETTTNRTSYSQSYVTLYYTKA